MKRNTLGRGKEALDKRFTAISKLMDSFAHAHEDFRGEQSIFLSSGSEDDDCPANKEERDYNDDSEILSKSSNPNLTISGRVSSCPYPSAAEEKSLHKVNPSSSYGCYTSQLGNVPAKKKQKSKICSPVKNSGIQQKDGDRSKHRLYISDDVLRSFVTFWKEACREHYVYEVLEKMFQFYEVSGQRKKKLKSLFSSYPCLLLLNVAVTSIRNGMWDSIYDTLQESGQQGIFDPDADNASNLEIIEIDVGDKDPYFQRIQEKVGTVNVEDLISRINLYYEQGHCVQSEEKLDDENQFILLRRFSHFQGWLAEQFSVKDFKDLGHGEIYTFMEKYASFFPKELNQLLTGDYFQQFPVEVCMPQQQLTVFLSQASRSIWEDKDTIKKKITLLLSRQFPLPCFNIKKLGVESCITNFSEKNKHVISSTVLFSTAIIGFHGFEKSFGEKIRPEVPNVIIEDCQRTRLNVAVTSKDAIMVLCKAPMLADLISWSHWDLIFTPVLGSLVQWLLKEVSATVLQSLVTKDGKIIRIDNNASVDSFFEAALQGSSYQTAVQLLSLFSLSGGVENVPFALLKNHASHIFEVIFKNHMEKVETTGISSDIRPCQRSVLKNEMAAASLSRFFIGILKYLPSEFRVFAADVLLPGLKAVIWAAASVVLSECKSTEDRIMLHDIGISLDIAEWIDDFHAFTSASDSSSVTRSIYFSESPCKIRNNKLSSELGGIKYTQSNLTFTKNEEICDEMNVVNEAHIKVDAQGLTDNEIYSDSTHLIESIRHEEFGLDPTHSAAHNTMLGKQHARLGRALQCLSQELYSQDSHFLLELVQNADDNVYPDNVERTLGFILRDNGIVVLNNEQGFSAQNIRALCDVGSSTKKGSGAGYIGHKGIGFKSVFRVTDAPEIHSNGYNFKFDISEGQIGFVLPSVVPSVDIKYLVNLIHDRENEEMTLMNSTWNTCIVLPFKPMSSTTHAVNNIISMFLDLHPSLLLFLHRLQCIRFRNMITNSFIVMRKEVLDDGIIKVSHGEEKMTWLVVSKMLQNTILRPEVKMTEISIAFTLDVTEDGNYIPNLNQQPVFAFLPLRNYGMKFILQGDFVLPSSREEVDVNSPWNQWLLSEFPTLFITAERSFCSLPFFTGCLGKAVTTYMSYIPLVSEVHGFFSSLPHMIISKLRLSNCMLLEGEEKWVPPCKVLRNWDENAYSILPPKLLYEHLGIGFLDKDIVLTDHVANALGIESYGPRILVQFLESLCSTVEGFSSMGIFWLCSWMSTLYSVMLAYSGQRQTFFSTDFEHDDIISSLRKISFIPLSDGTYGSADSDKIWYCGDSGTSWDDCGLEYFPNLASKLRIVEPSLFIAAKKCSASSYTCNDHIIRIIQKIGVQQLTAHDILKLHVLPIFSANMHLGGDVDLTMEYLTFTMFHLQSGCSLCPGERGSVISNLHKNALISTNYGSIRITEAPIHFGAEYGNCVNMDNFSCLKKMNWKWHVVDTEYLKHPINKQLQSPESSWRNFFKELGVTDFVQVVQVEKTVSDLPTHVVKNIIGDDPLIFHDSVVKDWESSELTHLLSSISLRHARDESKLLLEILDKLWDDCFDDKVLGYCKLKSDVDVRNFRSSFISDVCNIRWVASIVDGELHYPKDLFYECDEVSSVLGRYAPYTIHRVQNLKLVNDMGFKTRVCMNDALTFIDLWRTSGVPFKASTAQMSKFYSFIWKEITVLKDTMEKIPPRFCSGPFIFIPLEFGCPRDEVVSGLFASADQVFWRDSTGSMDKMKCSRQHALDFPLNKTLHHIYPDIHDFFVIECGVKETPSFHGYVEFLLQLSTLILPSQAKVVVSDILRNLAEEVHLGLVDSENISYLKKSIQDADFRIFPTVLDRWVSLHPSFGLICWADSNDLKKEFKHMENVDFLDIGDPDDEMISSDTKFFNLINLLAIPILSEVVTRVAIYNRTTDSDYKTSLVNCCLPYAQRYIYSLHPERYSQLENLECNVVEGLQVVVVEQLHYHNVIKRHGITSNKKFECASLLQGKILYTTNKCDLHTLFLELSKLFFPKPELYFANFLHMITTMLESGSSEEQTEFFILNSQRVPKLPFSKPVWSIPCKQHDQTTATDCTVSHPKPKRKPGIHYNWPPVDWKTVPGFGSDISNQFRTYPSNLPHFNNANSPTPHPCPSLEKRNSDGENVSCPQETSMAVIADSANFTGQEHPHSLAVAYDEHGHHHPSDISGKEEFTAEEQLTFGSNVPKHAVITGRMGEMLAFQYFSSCCEGRSVRWLNSDAETGLPYDIIIGNDETGMEFVEVKSTRSAKKNWFIITAREWHFALEKGDSFSIAHILLSSSNNVLKIRILKNPAMLIQQGMLRMVIMMPSQTDDDNNPPVREMNDQQQNIQLHMSY